MRDPVRLLLVFAGLTTVGCVSASWRAPLSTPATFTGAGRVSGSATMRPDRNGVDTRVVVTLANATPGDVLPWQMHHGQCGADSGVVGPAAGYAAVRIGGDGRGTGSATVPVAPTGTGRYFVAVQASAVEGSATVACGNLALASR